MLTKKSLKAEFKKDWKTHYEVELFKEKGFERKICKKCNRAFWSLDPDREICGDSSCVEYGFIGNTITKGKWDYIETWRLFERFFKKRGHTSVPRYPVVDRWRPDLYFTIASIQDFQRIDNGKLVFVYPANPLIVSQVSLRFGDIQNVGVTGRHLTSFIMSGQHAFNKGNEGYFKDRCIDLNFEFLNKEMGIPEKELVYMEDVWAMPDFSAFGPSIETFSRGLELVNSVFMQFTKAGSGYKELDLRVIDVGWGHERLVWFSNGTPASYDSLFGPVTGKLKKLTGVRVDQEIFDRYSVVAGALDLEEVPNIQKAKEKVAEQVGISQKELQEMIEPLQALYAITDHARTILFAVTDGGIPSNVGGGYNLRVILRRALSFIDEFDFNLDFADICEMHADYLKPLFPELSEDLDSVRKIIKIENNKYKQTKENTKRTIEGLISKGTKIDEDLLIKLYESKGITPEEIQKHKADIEIPSDFYQKITEKHSSVAEKSPKEVYDLAGIPETKILFYDKVTEFKARILKIIGNFVVLDRTAFYATSGGQEHDTGILGSKRVVDVIKQENRILHKLDDTSGLREGQLVVGKIDAERRSQLAKNHSAVHIVNGAAREVLGKHVWQAGSEVREDKARLDITHYASITPEEFSEIERIANETVFGAIDVHKELIERGEAEKRYGFRIYQGGAIPEKNLRIISVGDFDIEACGGTHVDNSGDVEIIKLLRSTKIQDGVVRLEFVAGRKAYEEMRKTRELLDRTAEVLRVQPEHVPKTAERFFNEWKELRKENKKLKAELYELKEGK